MDIFEKKGIRPMLISERVDPYDDEESIFEFKIDGNRCIAYNDKYSSDLRNKRDIKILPRFPELDFLYKNCRHKCILDGELNVLINGKPDFYEVQKRSTMTDPFKIELSYKRRPANFVAFDIIYYKDKLVTNLSLIERRKILEEVVSENNILSKSRYIDTNGTALFKLAEEYGFEGVVGKKKASQYWFGKETKEWSKVKVIKDDDYICIGYFPPSENNMTSLILAKYNTENKLVITNRVSLGVSVSKLIQYGVKRSYCPIENLKGYDNAIWIEPMVCTIEYMPSNKHGLRQATFKGMRNDKLPEECRIENDL
ncbi:DNA ligase [Clostridium sp. HBUAS56010]|uniref:ATP-dependent DNA ligase n=1 Tax=Clostridium sp. HBUAS56010 TaxID=2571127 RepID=UPI00117805A0|nr:DNA ligase [Clostridium sp. HBUAS56010]